MSDESHRSYRILSTLGQGGFGTVYLAELQSTAGFSKRVALKVLNADMAASDDVLRRLKDEARVLGLLRHRAIVQVDGLIFLDGRWTVVMEYVEGASLNQVLAVHPRLPPKLALAIVEEVAAALDVAYARPASDGRPMGLLHRDIKPPNLQLTATGEVKLLDFGIARADRPNREAQTTNSVFGSLPYMAPERFEFEDCHQSDIYSLGVTLFELITGEALGQASPNPRRHEERITEGLTRLRAVVDDPDIVQLIKDTLAYEPKDRPDARTFERRAHEIEARLPGQRLKDWADDAIPPIMASRPKVTDAMTDRVLVERTGATSITANQAPSEPPPAPPPAPAAASAAASPATAPKRRAPREPGLGVLAILTRIVLGLVGAGTFGVVTIVVIVVAFFLACCGGLGAILAFAAPDDAQINESIATVNTCTDDPNRAALLLLLDQSRLEGASGRYTLWEYSNLNGAIEDAAEDGTISDGELQALTASYAAMIRD